MTDDEKCALTREIVAEIKEDEALACAIDYLGATDLGNGRYAFKGGPDRDNPDAVWRVANTDDMMKCGALLPRGENDAPPEWIMDEAFMPSWWTPKHRFAAHYLEEYVPFPTRKLALEYVDIYGGSAVTVNLETGEEIRA